MAERKVAGRYRLLEHLGEGGMGIVWRAHDELLDRVVAVKEVRYRGVDEAARVDLNRRTIREARTAGRLDHPSVIIVHDVVEEEGRPWIVMQLVRSRSLGEIVRERGPLPPERVASVGLHVLGALRAAHAAGVLHRDVKPENVLLADDGRVVLTDFGIASMTQETGITRTGGMVGTPAFLPPERLHGLSATPESDLWSLGATLYAAAEGRPPFERATAAATMMAVLHGEPSSMTHSGPLAMAILGLMARDPAARMVPDQVEALLSRASSPAASSPPTSSAGPVSGWEPPPGQSPYPGGHTHPDQPQHPATHQHPGQSPYTHPGQSPYTHPGHGAYGSQPLRPGSWPLQEQPTGTGGGGGPTVRRAGAGRLALLAGVPALAVAIGVGGWLIVRNQDGTADPGSGLPTVTTTIVDTTPTPPAETTPAPTPATTATPRPSRTAPAGWRWHRDPMGFSVAVPRGWTVKRFSGRDRVEFRAPGASGFLWIESTDDPEKNPVRHWEKVERAGTADNVWPGYERIGITSLRYRGVPAADWEFTYLKNGVRTHVLDRGFRTLAGRPYAIYWESPESEWDRSLFDDFTRTFSS
ncbi:serine/threonine protein kinase [Streptosporangium sp. NBC_01810]|uniref:serine/threonine-protein kinase n=1 Tax=Streptosporangium sp. NBC_01810 TaxID=2975951 RepID=UPI002DD9C9C0|nr:serine/threonine-protein kinase [Streptosporangium sp. NBC_01810]WSA22832.1 serine/threonine protein kinase [Streptosporangium sp. NBC_01810]